MSELIDNSRKRKELLKHMIIQLHAGDAPEQVRQQLITLMQKIPYGEVVEVEQELISEGILDDKEVLKFCDLHSQALEGQIDHSAAKPVPWGHPVDTFKRENKELRKVIAQLEKYYSEADQAHSIQEVNILTLKIKTAFNQLMDVDKHYTRKENLLFPFLEKYGITGPPKVMWGKHDEIRGKLKAALEVLQVNDDIMPPDIKADIKQVLQPASDAVDDMIMKEEEILLPMSMDKLTDLEWYDIYLQTPEIGFCLFDPQIPWKPEGVIDTRNLKQDQGDVIHLPSGSFTREELQAILNTLPVDITFVNKEEKVKYFSQGKERIFHRNRTILNRDVKMCHPPSSVHVVEKILDNFKEGQKESAPFWIQMKDRFIHIEYFALRDEKGDYLGTLEVSQDLTDKRKLEGEQRLLTYNTNNTSMSTQPEWLSKAKIRITIDARPIIQSGGHPLDQVFKESAILASGEILELITPFPPAPLIEKMEARGYRSWSKEDNGIFFNYFIKE